jgi:hypothetical protein
MIENQIHAILSDIDHERVCNTGFPFEYQTLIEDHCPFIKSIKDRSSNNLIADWTNNIRPYSKDLDKDFFLFFGFERRLAKEFMDINKMYLEYPRFKSIAGID